MAAAGVDERAGAGRPSGRPLVVIALGLEAARLADLDLDLDVLLTGPGKVSAALAVASALVDRRPSRVLNVGTAGALRDGWAGAHSIGRVIEHDLDHAGLEALLGEPLPGEIVLDPTSTVTLATGDRFIQDSAARQSLARRAHLVDMEGYAVARACAAHGVACEMVKVVSDVASEGALRSWQETVDRSARLIADVVAARLG